jgi:hypothetical protein
MSKDFTLYPEAFKLKQLGFDEPCLATIDQTDFIHIKGTEYPIRGAMIYDTVDCPTYSQAFRWFRDKYSLCIVIKPIDDKKLDLGYNLLKNGLIMNAHLTYEGAELACLRNLIKIVKEQTNDKQ